MDDYDINKKMNDIFVKIADAEDSIRYGDLDKSIYYELCSCRSSLRVVGMIIFDGDEIVKCTYENDTYIYFSELLRHCERAIVSYNSRKDNEHE